jgi:hypothetical protein
LPAISATGALAGDVAKQMQQLAPSYAGTHYCALAIEAEHAGNAEAARQEYQAAISGWNAVDADFGVLTDALHRLAALPNPH